VARSSALVLGPALAIALSPPDEPLGRTFAAISFAAGAVLALAARWAHRTYQRRRDAPLEELRVLATILRDERMFLVDEELLGRCHEIGAVIRRDLGDSSRGVMRWVVAYSPAGRTRLFKTNSLAKAERVVELLAEHGVHRGKPPKS